MCGIAGLLYTDPHRLANSSTLRAMGNAIAHRGPDGEGLFQHHNVGMVHRRLAIIDLHGGDQPISNEDGTITVVFNGEIYNHCDLRARLESRGHQFRTQSDTEVLVHLYEEYGDDLVTHLRGMFAFALWDERNQRLLLVRDHVGQKPLYIYRDHEKLLFASEVKAILAHPRVNREIDSAAVEDYFTFGIIPGERGIFRQIKRLPAAHTLAVTAQSFGTAKRFWQLSFGNEQSGSDGDWKDRIAAAVTNAVRSHLVADVPVGAFLSGGLDSSLIVASLTDMLNAPLQTFSIGFQERRYSELPYAAEVAHHFGTIHTEQIVTAEAVRDLDQLTLHFDEPFADASAIPTMAVARMAAEHVKVVLSGDGGDEGFGGYSRYSHDLKEASIRDLLPEWLRHTVLKPMAVAWPTADWLPRPMRLKTLLQNLSSDPAAAWANTVSQCRTGIRSRLFNRDFSQHIRKHRPEAAVERAFRAGNRDVLSGMLAADSNTLLPDDFLIKVDRASMAHGLEVRPPLLDVPLLELAASMPSSMKIRGGCKKWILKQIYEPQFPENLAHRRKQGFELPVDEWLRGPLQSQIRDVILQESHPISQFIDTKYACRLNNQHLRHTGRHGQLLWSLLVFGRWLDAWSTPAAESHHDVHHGRVQLAGAPS